MKYYTIELSFSGTRLIQSAVNNTWNLRADNGEVRYESYEDALNVFEDIDLYYIQNKAKINWFSVIVSLIEHTVDEGTGDVTNKTIEVEEIEGEETGE